MDNGREGLKKNFDGNGLMLMDGLSGREKVIINQAEDFLQKIEIPSKPTETELDSAFILKFDPICCKWVGEIRNMLHIVLDLEGNDPLEGYEAFLWQNHLIENNSQLEVSLIANEHGTIMLPSTADDQGYICINPKLRKRMQQNLNMMPDEAELTKIAELVGQEAWITLVITNEISKFALVYGLFPQDSEFSKFSSITIQRILERITNWIITDKDPPSFVWKEVQFLEQKLKGVTRFISVCPVPTSIDRRIQLLQAVHEGPKIKVQTESLALSGYTPPSTDYARKHLAAADRCRSQSARPPKKSLGSKRITRPVRIRTWTIYYLTRRGGGIQTEESAISIWNYRFPNVEVKLQNYQKERNRLFDRISKNHKIGLPS